MSISKKGSILFSILPKYKECHPIKCNMTEAILAMYVDSSDPEMIMQYAFNCSVSVVPTNFVISARSKAVVKINNFSLSFIFPLLYISFIIFKVGKTISNKILSFDIVENNKLEIMFLACDSFP